jgi:hypothetical protein
MTLFEFPSSNLCDDAIVLVPSCHQEASWWEDIYYSLSKGTIHVRESRKPYVPPGIVKRTPPLQVRCLGSRRLGFGSGGGSDIETGVWPHGIGVPGVRDGNFSESDWDPEVPGSKTQIFGRVMASSWVTGPTISSNQWEFLVTNLT